MMKSYDKMANEVLGAVNEKNARKIKRNIKLRIAVPSACCCLVTVLALGVWQSGIWDKNGLSSEPENNFHFTEETTTETQSEAPAASGVLEPEKTADENESGTDEVRESIGTTADPETSESSDTSAYTSEEMPVLSTEEDPAVPQTETLPTAETQGELVPIDGDEPYQYMKFVENVHAPLDDYEFSLPLTPKDTDIILALLKAYDFKDSNDRISVTHYSLDIGTYLEAGDSFVRTYIQAATGDEVYALEDGTVVYADWNAGLGRVVYVENLNGTYIVYSHLSEFAVSEGDTVSKDQVIGYAGTSGMATHSSASYIRRDTISDIININWHREDGKISFDDFHIEEPPKENILPVEPPLIPEIQGGNQSSNNNIPSDETAVIYGGAIEAAEKYANIDGSLSSSIGKEQENRGTPVGTASTTLLSVGHDDERKFTAEEWLQILEMIKDGKVFWED
ncbi:MAG: M23 family metallopeptidase [Ruminococcaceae bacterium]|nr:M23 family metallopeptidase [Oscillospiraceae bacterium]